ncbi:hypothetical protein P4S72_15135 [Vibrio sp. PP-XX7]
MKLSEHADRTEQLFGIRAEDIHQWIDGFFDHNGRDHSRTVTGDLDYDPYNHRRFRHCKEALAEAIQAFGDHYTHQQIKDVFETHIRDDYDGYLPSRADFENDSFTAKYHDAAHDETISEVLDASEFADYFHGLHTSGQDTPQSLTRFSLRIVLPTIAAIVLFITAIIYVVVPLAEESMLGQKRQMLKALTATAVSIANNYIALEQRGLLSRKRHSKKRPVKLKRCATALRIKIIFLSPTCTPRW